MQIEISTDNNTEVHEKRIAHFKTVVEGALARFSKRITRVEVHISDENGPKDGHNDSRCMMEARLEGRPPIAVTCQEDDVEKAVSGAATKLKHLIDSTLGRESSLSGHRDHQ